MGDLSQASSLSTKSSNTSHTANKKVARTLAVSSPNNVSRKKFWPLEPVKSCKFGKRTAGNVALFLLEVSILELVRRFARAKCPFVWRGVQTMQLLSYPPLKWIQRWKPFKGLVKGMQMLSKPLLVLSIATAFSEKSECTSETSAGIEESDVSDSRECSEAKSELPSRHATLGTRCADNDARQSLVPESWLVELYKELENQGISLPDRLDEDELHRFYNAANGSFSCFLYSIKKTIRWRENYNILSVQELEMWSYLVFWHDFDVKQRPCLIVRLGLACSSLPSHDRPRFAQAVVSQIERGILHLIDAQKPQITVLVDCEGLSPLKVPMQMMRSCFALLQDNFPNRLGCLFIIRLPSVVCVMAQTIIKVLSPVTRQKLRIEGEKYQEALSVNLLMLPSYLGGKCTCTRCSKVRNFKLHSTQMYEENKSEPISDTSDDEDLSSTYPPPTIHGDCNQILRTAIVGILICWIFLAIIAGFYDAESRQFSTR